MATAPIVGIEIGTTEVIALVGEQREDGHVVITGMGRQPSAGVRKGEIIDLENAVICVRSVLEQAEESSKVSIRQVHLAAAGSHIQSFINRGAVPVLDPSGEITRDDVEQVMSVACAINLPADREILHTICQHYRVDDQDMVVQPEGMEGAQLGCDVLVLHGARTRLHNTVKVVRDVPVDLEDVVFSGLCSALAVLTPEQKQSGVLVVDLGGGTTDYVAYARDTVAMAGSFGVGGDHVTNDIALAFNIPTAKAERIKREKGQAQVDLGDGPRRLILPAEVGFTERSISVKALQTVINARVDETLGMIRQRLEHGGILHRLGAGIVLTGGGARLKGVAALAEKIFNRPAVVGSTRHVSGLAAVNEDPSLSAPAGLVQYGFQMLEKERASGSLGNWLKGFFGK